ncbi:MAG: hypothetical protein AAF531_11710 [Actinomycetota bacterium]
MRPPTTISPATGLTKTDRRSVEAAVAEYVERPVRTRPEPSGALLAYGLLEELYRRRRAVTAALVMILCLIAAAVGVRVWGVAGSASTALDTPGYTVSDSSAEDRGPMGTWQRWGDLGSQKRSAPSLVDPSGSSTTTFTSGEDGNATTGGTPTAISEG